MVESRSSRWTPQEDALFRWQNHAGLGVFLPDGFVPWKRIVGLRYEFFCCAGRKLAERCNPAAVIFRRVLDQDVHVSGLSDQSVECQGIAADQHVFGAVLFQFFDQQEDIVPSRLTRLAGSSFEIALFGAWKC